MASFLLKNKLKYVKNMVFVNNLLTSSGLILKVEKPEIVFGYLLFSGVLINFYFSAIFHASLLYALI